MNETISQAAEEVLRALNMWRLPVDPKAIAAEENISLAPGVYGDGFDARIEYFPEFRRFGIYFRETERSEGRIQFSLAHELGHFYLPSHRHRLLNGDAHNSQCDYRSADPIEREADEFAANLLMPKSLFTAEVQRFRQSVCDLKDIGKLADRVKASMTSTAIRYCTCNIEPVTMVLSWNGVVQWSWSSEDMKEHGCWYVKSGSAIPARTQTAQLIDRLEHNGEAEAIGHRIDPHRWFDWPKCQWLYEEAMPLGDRILTWIVIDE